MTRAVVDVAPDETPAPSPSIAAAPLTGDAIYSTRCAACHDHPEGSIPPRARLATRSHARIVDTLTNGAMRPYAQGLTAVEIDRVATYLR